MKFSVPTQFHTQTLTFYTVSNTCPFPVSTQALIYVPGFTIFPK